jgi:hypothetical protein
MHHRGERGARVRCGNRLKLTGIRSLKIPGPGAVAHMSLHQKPTMSKSHRTKEADNNGSPIYTGGPVVRLMLATEAMEPVETGSTASVRGHIWVAVSRVNSLLQFYFKEAGTRGFPPFLACFAYGNGLQAIKARHGVNDSTAPRPEHGAPRAGACSHPLFTLCS